MIASSSASSCDHQHRLVLGLIHCYSSCQKQNRRQRTSTPSVSHASSLVNFTIVSFASAYVMSMQQTAWFVRVRTRPCKATQAAITRSALWRPPGMRFCQQNPRCIRLRLSKHRPLRPLSIHLARWFKVSLIAEAFQSRQAVWPIQRSPCQILKSSQLTHSCKAILGGEQQTALDRV